MDANQPTLIVASEVMPLLFMRRGWVGCVLLLAVVGCSSNGKVTQAPVPASSVYIKCYIDKPTTIAQSKPPPGFKIDVALTFAPSHATTSSPSVASPSAGEYEVATVRISSSSGSFRYAANSFRFVTGDNHSYPPVAEDTGQAFGPPLGAGTLTAGQAVSATITFDVPIGGGHVGFFDQSGLQMCGWPVAN